MPDRTITLATGRRVDFAMPEAGAGLPCFLLGVRKCGSSVLNNIVKSMAALNGRGFIDVGHTFFSSNVLTRDWQRDAAVRDILGPGIIYGGFRDMPLCLLEDARFATAPKFLMVRDPRDALVSEYFSNAYSHRIPERTGGSDDVAANMAELRRQALSADIGTYVLRMGKPMNHTMSLFAPALALPGMRVVKYEDMIFDKAELIGLLARDFDLPVSAGGVANILGWADEMPAVENPRAFVRRVTPGDHRGKLDQATIERLNVILRPCMAMFGYAA